MTEQELAQLKWEASDDDDAPEFVSKSLVLKLIAAYESEVDAAEDAAYERNTRD